MKRIATLFLIISVVQAAFAAGTKIGDLYYNLNSSTNTAEVTSQNENGWQNGYPSYTSLSGDITIPATVKYGSREYKVTKIANRAFQHCEAITSVTLPDGIVSIGFDAFFYTTNLKSINLPESLTSIGTGSFERSGLTSVTIPGGIGTIPERAFDVCFYLETVVISEGITRIDNDAFNGCNLINLTLPESVSYIGDNAFYSTDISEIHLPENITYIGNSAFWGTNLKSVILPEKLTTLNKSVFASCKSLETVVFSEGLTSIGQTAFSGCSSLRSITLPNSVTTIGDNAFKDCTNLSSAILSENLTSIPSSCFENCSNLTSVVIKDGLKYIRSRAFQSCYALEKIILPPSLIVVDFWAFNEYNTNNLKTVISLNPVPPTNDYTSFSDNIEAYGTLYVPSSSLNAYKTTNYWNEFKNILPLVRANTLKILGESNNLVVGHSMQLSVSTSPTNATVTQFDWSSSDDLVATVNANGEVMAISPGKVTIYAKTIDGSNISAGYEIIVSKFTGSLLIPNIDISNNERVEIPVSIGANTTVKYSALQFDVTLPDGLQLESAELGQGLSSADFQLTCKVQPSGAIRVIVTPTSFLDGVNYSDNILYLKVKASNQASPGVRDIQISNGYLSSVAGSDLVLDDSSASVTFLPTIKTITLAPQTQNIVLGQRGSITAAVQPVDAANQQLQWRVDNPSVIEISGNGLHASLRAIKLGSVTVTAVSPYDETIQGVATVNVVGTLEITGEKSIIKTTETLQLKAVFVENEEIIPNVRWSSSAPQYVSVNSNTGLVTGIAAGKAVITATSTEFANLSATFEVEVEQILLGDANDNGTVTVADVVTIANFIAKKEVVGWSFVNADITRDKQITTADITGTVNIIAGQDISPAAVERRAPQFVDDRLITDDFSPVDGVPFHIGVRLDNTRPYSALQASVVIPEGMTVDGVTKGSQASTHSLIHNITDEGRVEVVIFSISNQPFSTSDGSLFDLEVRACADCGDLIIENILASDTSAKDYELIFEGGRNSGVITGLDNTDELSQEIIADSEGIMVLNAGGMDICIYSVTGETIAKRKATDNPERFNLAKGIYIVTVEGKSIKIII